jgi:hypothetical protein
MTVMGTESVGLPGVHRSCFMVHNAITNAAHGFEPGLPQTEFLTQALDMRVECPALRRVAVTSDDAQKLVAVLGFSRTLTQE